MNKKRSNRGRFAKKSDPPNQEKPKKVIKPKAKPTRDEGDDVEEVCIQRVDNVTTLTGKTGDRRIVKLFVQDASRYVIGAKHDFRIARNGAYHEIEPPPPLKKYMDYSEYIRT